MRKDSERCFKCSNEYHRGERNPNWKGGTTISKAGYIYVYQGHQKYLAQHVLVMEEFIGRRLNLGENVHHVNGVKDDNRIENLELWTKPQPTGIRASDALNWARNILALYEPIEERISSSNNLQ